MPRTPGRPSIERERKFLIHALPHDLSRHPSALIEQGYLAIGGAGEEVRVRRTGARHVLTIKRGHGAARTEVEVPLSAAQALVLWPLTRGRRIRKRRYRIAHDDSTIELDVYRGAQRGLVVAEVEFPSQRGMDRFAPPPWFGREVTGDAHYSNAAIATSQSPPGANG